MLFGIHYARIEWHKIREDLDKARYVVQNLPFCRLLMSIGVLEI